MIKGTITYTTNEKLFIRQAIVESGVRLDGRNPTDYRDVSINLIRQEQITTAEVQLGSTFAVATVSGVISTPYPDRPIEGQLNFSVEISTNCSLCGVSKTDLERMLERSIRESEAMDLESLCIIGGEKVWSISCEVNILDNSGGNVSDACSLAAIAAIKAFRKPDTSVASVVDTADSLGTRQDIIIHHSNDREPLPLALQHTPLSVTLGIYRTASNVNHQAKVEGSTNSIIFVTDPSLEEDDAIDGKITFTINAHGELCAINKPGGAALSPAAIVVASKIALKSAEKLHRKLHDAVQALEVEVLKEREESQEALRKYKEAVHLMSRKVASDRSQFTSDGNVSMDIDATDDLRIAGIDRNDPILAWSSLHKAATLREE